MYLNVAVMFVLEPQINRDVLYLYMVVMEIKHTSCLYFLNPLLSSFSQSQFQYIYLYFFHFYTYFLVYYNMLYIYYYIFFHLLCFFLPHLILLSLHPSLHLCRAWPSHEQHPSALLWTNPVVKQQ